MAGLLLAGNHDDGQEMFKQWDTDDDGVVSRAEARAAQIIAEHDANKDGQLTAEEIRTPAQLTDGEKTPHAAKLKSADTNADGAESPP